MKKSSIIRAYSLIGLAIIGTVFLIGAHVFAQAGSAGSGQGVTVSPALVELNAEPGGIYTLKIKVTNVTTGDQNYVVNINDFRAKNESGSPQVLLKSDLPPSISIRTWMNNISTFQLKTQESKVITFNVKVPSDAEPGGHYGVLRFSAVGEDVTDTTGVSLTASAGTLLLVKVAGAIDENARVIGFYGAKDGKRETLFESSPINFVTRIQNVGNLHLKPHGTIKITNIFGAEVASLPVNKVYGNVLPNSIRRFENAYKNYTLGPYTAKLELAYGSHGQVLEASTSFWVVPYRLIGVILLVLALVIFILRRMQKAYNRRVIKKFQNQKNEPKKGKRS